MTYSIKYREDSLFDFNKGIAYYNLISETLTDNFINEFWTCIDALKENPKACQIRYSNIRIIKLQKFPFTIHFILEEETVFVQRVLHEKRFY